jgi:tetratricopeptide (TPR) repeat protein
VLAAPAAELRLEARQDATMASLYAEHLAGRVDRLRTAFPTDREFRRARLEIFQTVREWRSGWTPSQAAFLFDLVLVGYQRNWEDANALLAATRDWVVTRPGRPGTSARDDAFEVTFHRAALSLLVGLGYSRLGAADAYVAALNRRVSDGLASGPPDGRLRDPRFAIIAGELLEIRTAPGYQTDLERAGLSSWGIRADDNELRRRAEQALVFYGRAMLNAETSAEAATRRAFLLHRLGRHADGLRELSVADSSKDRAVTYWAELVRGRVLEALGRAGEAGQAYERAAAIAPGAQTPAVALASLWQRHGQPENAVPWASRVRSGSLAGPDPWWDYWLGERRFLGERLTMLREARP